MLHTTLAATIAYFVGIDVSKATLVVFVRPSGERFSVPNTASGIRSLVERLARLTPTLIVLEATGGLERGVAAALTDCGVAVAVVNPRRVHHFARALDRAKTDPIDAEVLAFFGEAVRPPQRPVRDAAALERDALETRRRQLVQMLACERNHRASAPEAVRALVDEQIEHLRGLIAELDARLRAAVSHDTQLAAKRDVLQTAPGIGEVTSTMLVALVPELGELSGKQIARLIGVAPLNDDSGTVEGARHCRGGRDDVRTALYMPTLTATRKNPKIKPFYERLIARGKPHKVAMIASMRKLLTMLNAMVRDNAVWSAEPTPSH
jgi:transposase